MGEVVRHEPPGEAGGQQLPEEPRQVPRGRRRVMIAGATLLALAVIAVGIGTLGSRLSSAGGTAAGHGTATATATLGPPRTLYQADWSHGVGDWTLPAHWQVRDGTLLSDGQGTTSLPVPFTITVPNYTITWQAAVVDVPAVGGSKFGMAGLSQSGDDRPLFAVHMLCRTPGASCIGQSTLGTQGADPNNSGDGRAGSKRSAAFAAFDFSSTSRVRTYRIKVLGGKGVDLCIDDSCLDSVTSLKLLAPIQLALTDEYVQMSISSLVITTP